MCNVTAEVGKLSPRSFFGIIGASGRVVTSDSTSLFPIGTPKQSEEHASCCSSMILGSPPY